MQKKRWRLKACKEINKSIKKIFFIVVIIIGQVAFNFASAQGTMFPVPEGNAKQLFFLQRTPNSNTIVCELNYKDGIVDKQTPIHVFWIRYQEKGQMENLSYLQRKFAYGVQAKEIGANKYELNFVSYKKYKMYLMLGADNEYHVYTSINQKQVILNRIYIEIKGGTFWSPNIEYVELTGVDPTSRSVVKERRKI